MILNQHLDASDRKAGRSETVCLSCTEVILFTYVNDTIWSCVNLQRPSRLHLAALQAPNSQIRGLDLITQGRRKKWFANKEGGGGHRSPVVLPYSFWKEAGLRRRSIRFHHRWRIFKISWAILTQNKSSPLIVTLSR